jgi:hypothetical protein
LHWLVSQDQDSNNLDHYLDDFFFVGRPHTHERADVMASFSKICNSVSVPIADDKTEGPTTSMKYLGLLIDTEKMMVKIPTEKLNKLLEEIKKVAFAKKVTLNKIFKKIFPN